MSAKTIYKTDSPISGKISVMQRDSMRELYVKGVKQSIWSEDTQDFEGSYWQACISIPVSLDTENPKFLVCGLGGGTIPKMLSLQYPTSTIDAIEIDPVIIQVANNWFDLKQFPNIHVIRANANNYLMRNSSKLQHTYDAIWLDTFFGEVFSLDTQEKLLTKIKQMLTANGVLITNRVYNEYERKVDAFTDQISSLFFETKTKIIEGYSGNDNLIVYAQNNK